MQRLLSLPKPRPRPLLKPKLQERILPVGCGSDSCPKSMCLSSCASSGASSAPTVSVTATAAAVTIAVSEAAAADTRGEGKRGEWKGRRRGDMQPMKLIRKRNDSRQSQSRPQNPPYHQQQQHPTPPADCPPPPPNTPTPSFPSDDEELPLPSFLALLLLLRPFFFFFRQRRRSLLMVQDQAVRFVFSPKYKRRCHLWFLIIIMIMHQHRGDDYDRMVVDAAFIRSSTGVSVRPQVTATNSRSISIIYTSPPPPPIIFTTTATIISSITTTATTTTARTRTLATTLPTTRISTRTHTVLAAARRLHNYGNGNGNGGGGSRSNNSPKGFGPQQGRNPHHHHHHRAGNKKNVSPMETLELLGTRLTQLEQLVASQTVEIQRLKDQVKDWSSMAISLGRVVELLRQAGLDETRHSHNNKDKNAIIVDDNDEEEEEEEEEEEDESIETLKPRNTRSSDKEDHAVSTRATTTTTEEIFGSAPSSVIEAADEAGASILAAILGGKKRILVDVRDAQLSDPSQADIWVQFIELAVLPVAAGLEGLLSQRNRLKIVFPTLSQLLQYRKLMALTVPDVVALSTLKFDPVEPPDNLVVIVAPAPDDSEGYAAMNELLESSNRSSSSSNSIDHPIVVLNHHMVPVSGPAADFEVAYHLRLLSVQYMARDSIPEDLQQTLEEVFGNDENDHIDNDILGNAPTTLEEEEEEGIDDVDPTSSVRNVARDAAIEAAMKYAQAEEVTAGKGVRRGHLPRPYRTRHGGVTRAMVIRAYPKPWHVFVDTSPETDAADFVVAATFDDEPTTDQVNLSIVECLEGSEEEDAIVAQQMQQALENGQLDRVTEIIGNMGMYMLDTVDDDEEMNHDDDIDHSSKEDDITDFKDDNDDAKEEEGDDNGVWDMFNEDSV